MWKVKCIEDFGTWCKKGIIIDISNETFFWAEKRGYVKGIKNLGLYGGRKPKDWISLGQWEKDIRKQERERILKIIDKHLFTEEEVYDGLVKEIKK